MGGGGSGTTAGASGSGGAAAGSGGAAVGGTGGAAVGGGGSGGGGAAVPCPADKTFCSGFEETTLPAGAVYEADAAPGEWTRDFEVDSTVFRSGKSSLKVKVGMPGATNAYQMLAVPTPGNKFWARFYVRQAGMDLGAVEHTALAGAADSSKTSSEVMIEFAEDVGLSFNSKDDVRWPMGFGRINGTPTPFTLAKDTWHCIELSFDGAARVQQVYIEGELKIDATNFPATVAKPLAFFKFGFNKIHGPARELWYDDVAVGPTRPGCLPAQ